MLRTYLEATAAGAFTTAWRQMCAADQAARPLDDYRSAMASKSHPPAPDRTYATEEIDEDHATVVVTWSSPDVATMAQQAQDGIITMKEYGQKLRTGAFDSKPMERTYRLRLEEEGWRVVVGFRSRGGGGPPFGPSD